MSRGEELERFHAIHNVVNSLHVLHAELMKEVASCDEDSKQLVLHDSHYAEKSQLIASRQWSLIDEAEMIDREIRYRLATAEYIMENLPER